MMELLPFILKALIGKYKTVQPTRTETITTTSGTVPELRKWKEGQTKAMIENQARISSRPHSERIYDTFKPISQDPIRTSGPAKTIGITGGPPITTTKETVTYSTGPARRIRV